MLPSDADLWTAANGSRAGSGVGDSSEADNTLTFLVGFGVLVLFVLGGVLASVFLCVTLKKDPYLWDAGPEGELRLPPGDCSAEMKTAPLSESPTHAAADAPC